MLETVLFHKVEIKTKNTSDTQHHEYSKLNKSVDQRQTHSPGVKTFSPSNLTGKIFFYKENIIDLGWNKHEAK